MIHKYAFNCCVTLYNYDIKDLFINKRKNTLYLSCAITQLLLLATY